MRRNRAPRTLGTSKYKKQSPRLRGKRVLLVPVATWAARAAFAGKRYARKHPVPAEGLNPSFLNGLWCDYFYGAGRRRTPFSHYVHAANAFLGNYCVALGVQKPDWVLIPTTKTVTAVVTVLNEEQTLARVLGELRRMPLHEIIVLINGSTDQSFAQARKCPISTIVHYADPLGHDVGRSLGAKLANSDMVIFLDGDIPLKAEKLLPLIKAVHTGKDIALNNISPYLGVFSRRDSVSIMKEFLNRVMGRSDLKANSLTAIPHVMSRQAIEKIGANNLTVPPKAQALAIKHGLRICAPTSIDVTSYNRIREHNTGRMNPVSRMIIGDHLEAIHKLMEQGKARLEFPDHMRKRTLVTEGEG
jgi:hypothetical protein